MTLKAHWLGSFAWKAISGTTKVYLFKWEEWDIKNGKRYEYNALCPIE